MILILLLLHNLVFLYRRYCFGSPIMCSLVAHDRLQTDYKENESSIGDREIPNDATVKELKALGATFNFIYIWL